MAAYGQAGVCQDSRLPVISQFRSFLCRGPSLARHARLLPYSLALLQYSVAIVIMGEVIDLLSSSDDEQDMVRTKHCRQLH